MTQAVHPCTHIFTEHTAQAADFGSTGQISDQVERTAAKYEEGIYVKGESKKTLGNALNTFCSHTLKLQHLDSGEFAA